jgi:adenylyltransferase/sulfurtransferase
VLGALCGVIGSLQALEAIKLVTNIGEPLRGRLLTYHALTQEFNRLTLTRDPKCPLCGTKPSIKHLTHDPDEPAACVTSTASVPLRSDAEIPVEISVIEAKQRRDAAPDRTLIIDVREPYELEICHVAGAEHIPMRQIPAHVDTLARDKHLMILCHSGARSRRVTEFLRAQGLNAVSNITGGIDAWAEAIEPGMRRY